MQVVAVNPAQLAVHGLGDPQAVEILVFGVKERLKILSLTESTEIAEGCLRGPLRSP